jgi:hypothetical protein
MILVAVVAVWYWKQASAAQWRWFWLGAGLWTVAVLAKVVIALFTNPLVIGFFKDRLSHWPFVVAGGLYLGIESSLCEIGLTWLAGLRWKEIGRDSGRAIAVGVGAGAFEAFFLGLAALAGVLAALAGVPGTEAIRDDIQKAAATTPLYWLLGPVERITAIICHASSRALVLLGTRYGSGGMVALGFLIFTLLDGTAGGAILSGLMGKVSMWWYELAFAVFAIVSLPLLSMCHRRYAQAGKDSSAGNAFAETSGI